MTFPPGHEPLPTAAGTDALEPFLGWGGFGLSLVGFLNRRGLFQIKHLLDCLTSLPVVYRAPVHAVRAAAEGFFSHVGGFLHGAAISRRGGPPQAAHIIAWRLPLVLTLSQPSVKFRVGLGREFFGRL